MRFRGGKPLVYGDPFVTGGGTPAWTPAALSPVLWLDAKSAGTITVSGSNVTSWADRAGVSGTFTQSNGLLQPTYSTTDPAFGTSVVGGASGSLASTSFPSLTQATVSLTFKMDTRNAGTYQMLFHIGTLNADQSILIGFNASFDFLWIRWINGGGSTAVYSTTTWSTASAARNVYMALDLSQTGYGFVQSLYVNNVSDTKQAGGVGATAGTTAANIATVLAANGSSTYASLCTMAEAMVFNSVLSASNQNLLWSYTQSKWGL